MAVIGIKNSSKDFVANTAAQTSPFNSHLDSSFKPSRRVIFYPILAGVFSAIVAPVFASHEPGLLNLPLA